MQHGNTRVLDISFVHSVCVCVLSVYLNEQWKNSHLCRLIASQTFGEDEFVVQARFCVFLPLCIHLFLLFLLSSFQGWRPREKSTIIFWFIKLEMHVNDLNFSVSSFFALTTLTVIVCEGEMLRFNYKCG